MCHSLLNHIKNKIQQTFPDVVIPAFAFEKPKLPEHGDLAINVAMSLAKQLKDNPRAIAAKCIENIENHDLIEKITVAGPGFINIHLSKHALAETLNAVINDGDAFYRHPSPTGTQKIYLEYVSANPTGPLHVGHGRAAVIGKAIGRLLKLAGHDVTEAYFVNDAGLQIDTLTCSVIARLVEKCQTPPLHFPSFFYQGDYIQQIADEIDPQSIAGLSPESMNQLVLQADLTPEELQNRTVTYIKENVSQQDYAHIKQLAVKTILDGIATDLKNLGITYDEWFNESSLLTDGTVAHCLEQLKRDHCIYEQDGAIWFKSSQFGDDKDRVIVRSNGENTYFMNDIAYHYYKFKRADVALNLMGSDHHGYGPRLNSVRQALHFDDKILNMQYIQFAILWQGGEKLSMSTRSGQFVTLQELYRDVGVGPTLFFYAMKKPDQHLDFDLDLAKKKSNENPYFYVQYAHARISQIRAKSEQGDNIALDKLNHPLERQLMVHLYYFPMTLERACQHLEPHLICYYLIDLAKLLHAYYADVKILEDDDTAQKNARLYLLTAVQNMLANGLGILGITPADKM